MKHDLQSLKTFLAIADEGSIAKAAERENTVPSGLSKRLSEMEDAYGTALVMRHRRGVTLTPAGVELISHARRVVDELAQMDSTMSEFASGTRGQVRLLANTSAIVQFLPDDLTSFLQKHPTIKIDLEERTSEQVQKIVQDGLADIGILVTSKPPQTLVCKPLRSDSLYVMMPKKHPLASKKKLKFTETLEYDHVGLPRGSSLCETLLAAAYDLNKPMKLRIQTASFDGIRKMVSLGLGISVLPMGSVLPYLDVEGLVACPLDEKWAERNFSLITRERSTLTRIAKLLVDHLIEAGQEAEAKRYVNQQ